MTDSNAPKARTEIQETTIRQVDSDAFRVDMVVADMPDIENAEAAFSLSVVIAVKRRNAKDKLPGFHAIQREALMVLSDLVHEHTRALSDKLNKDNRYAP